MKNLECFEIFDDVLIKYLGNEENVEIPFGIKTIGEYAFANSNVKTVIMPNSVNVIAANAFTSCRELEKIDIPDSVAEIGASAFSSCENLVSIKIPSKITQIENNTFAGCRKLDICIPENVTYIGGFAFNNTQMLNVTIPKNVKKIEHFAFSCECQRVEILGDIASLSANVFWSSERLREFVVPDDHPRFKAIDGNLYTKDGKKLICYAKGKKEETFIIPDGVEIIGAYACSNAHFKNIIFSETVRTIDNNAFERTGAIKELTIPGNIKTIRSFAFQSCHIKTINIQEGLEYVGTWAITGNFDKIVIPNSIKKIDQSGFMTTERRCFIDLTKVDENAEIFPSFIARNVHTWSSDNAIHCILLSKTLKCNFTVGYGLYIDVEPQNLTERDIEVISSFPLEELPIDHRRIAVLNFAKGYFSGAKYLADFKKERIQYMAEHYNEWLEDALKNPILMAYFIDKKLLTIDQAKDILQTQIEHEETVELLRSYTKSKQSKPFKKYRKGFTDIPEDTTSINCGAFACCNNITDIIIPDNVISIGSLAFYKVATLKSVSLGKSLKYIGIEAFWKCQNLKTIYFRGTISEWNKIHKGERWFDSWCTVDAVICADGEIKIEKPSPIPGYDPTNSKTFMHLT